MTCRACGLLAAAVLSGWTSSAAGRAEAWSSDWIEVTAKNGVKDDYYPLQTEPEKCSFKFRVMRNADNTIGVEAFVRDDKIVVDDSPAGSISCPTWKDDCLEVFFDGDDDRNPNTRGPDWNDNPTPCNAGGEYAIAANGATQSDYASAKKCFGSLWGGFAEPWNEGGSRVGTHYRLWFTWDCLGRPAPSPGEPVPLRMTVCIHDDDDGGACDYALYWKGNPKYPFADESAFGEIVIGGIPAPRFADCSLMVQFDKIDLAELGCGELMRRARLAGAGSVQIERCDFYLDGERRAKELETLSGEIRFFEQSGFPVALWITSLGYGPMTDKDFLRRFPDYRPLRSFEGRTAAVCSTDARWREAVAENVRDFIRAGAKTILFDDDLVQACRPGICCACDEHRRRIAARLGVADVTPEQMRDAYAGAPNPLRTACLDEMGESLMAFCRAMRAAADEIDPSVTIATCLSISQYDLDGVDVPQMVRLLSGKGAGRPFVRLSGATYWVCHPGNSRNWGQGLGGVIEYLRWQAAMMRAEGIVPLDENDPYPRDVRVVPEGMCEAYDRAMIAEGGIVRNKYVIRHNVKTNKGIDPEYLAAHLAGREEAERIAALFSDAAPVGFEVFAPPHLVRDATLPEPYAGKNALLKFFAQPLAGILLAANGAPTRYDRDSGAPVAVLGPAAATLPKEWLTRGVLIDRDGARILKERGVDTGLDAKEGVSRIGGWSLYENARGEKFAVSEVGWYDLDCREASPTPVPVREIWKFFTGKDIPVCLAGARCVHLIAKRRPDGSLVVLANNTRGGAVGPFAVNVPGASYGMALPAYGCRTLQVGGGGN